MPSSTCTLSSTEQTIANFAEFRLRQFSWLGVGSRRKSLFQILMIAACCHTCLWAAEEKSGWFDRQETWQGYPQFHFKIGPRDAYLVTPNEIAEGRPWVWRARFPNYHAEMDVQLLRQGFHIGYVDVAGLFGSPHAVDIGDQFYDFMVNQRGLSARPVLEGVSRGGLLVYNWAARNPDRISAIYCDTPVCDFKSWPGGRGQGLGSADAWQQCLTAHELTEEDALAAKCNPLDHAKVLAEAKIPILHVVSESDRVVPAAENTYALQRVLEKHGHTMQVISVQQGTPESHGHHFTHPDPDRVVRFVVQHASGDVAVNKARMQLLRDAKRIVFLGDSITFAGHYVAQFEAWLLSQRLPHPATVINVGLPSETVSGLSEDGHAGGRFPRPDLAERLERVLAVTKPDLVFACYGINCGIYQPFDEQRFASYQTGIRKLKKQIEAAGARVVLMTPPTFDDANARKSFSYDQVMDRYATWLLDQSKQGWRVIDLHGPMKRDLVRRRESDPEFTFQPDSVHPNAAGHEFIAANLIGWFGGEAFAPPPELVELVSQRMRLLRNAYVGAAGHQRPGIETGLPVAWAKDRGRQLGEKIEQVLNE